MGLVVSSSHFVSAAPSSSGGGLLTLLCRSEFDWSQQGPQCGAIDKGGRAGTCWSQALGGNKIVPSHLEGGSIALVKINLEKRCPRQHLC